MVMKKQSNTYTLIYAVALVFVVGVLLSVDYQALHQRQEVNIANDTRLQILHAARIPTGSGDVADKFNSHIKKAYIVNYHGVITDRNPEHAFNACLNMASEFKQPGDRRKLPVLECATPDGIKYIVPVSGAGLWGPIWGYVAFDSNGSTIYGAYFAHQGETPGLGAEIEKPKFSDQFEGKNIFTSRGKFTSVTVCKPGQEPSSGDYVHGVSGGTITSQGVSKMLRESLEPYTQFFRTLRN